MGARTGWRGTLDVVWQRTHGGRLLHALARPPGASPSAPPASGPAVCGARVNVDLRRREPEDRQRCRRCLEVLAPAAGETPRELPPADPGMLF